MDIQASKIVKKFPTLVGRGNQADAEVSSIASYENACENSIVFTIDKNSLQQALSGAAAVIVTSKKFSELYANTHKVILTSSNTRLAMALVAQTFFPIEQKTKAFDGNKVHPTALISESAKVHDTATIAPYVVISEGCHISANCFIGAGTVLEANVQIGDSTYVGAQVYLGLNTQVGKNCELKPQSSIGTEGYGYATDESQQHHRIPHYGKVILEDNVHLGSGVRIDRGTFEDTIIGNNTKVDNHIHFAHNFNIGKNGLVTAGAIVAGSSSIGDNFVCGGRFSMNGHKRVTDNVQMLAMSVVHNNVDKPGSYGGYPLMSANEARKAYANFGQITQLRKNLKRVMKKLGLN